MPLAAAPSKPHLFETVGGALDCAVSPVVECVQVAGVEDFGGAEAAWKTWHGLLEARTGSKLPMTFGESVNLEVKTFAGCVGWPSRQVSVVRISGDIIGY
jgi:hypothetical protein